MGADQGDIDAPGDHWFQRRIGGRLAEAVEAPVLQVRECAARTGSRASVQSAKTWSESPPPSVWWRRAADLALVIEQRVQHMQRLARRRRDQLGVEGPVAVREVRVDLEARLLAVVGVETAGVAAEAARPGRTGRRTTRRCRSPNSGRERLALLLVDQTPQRQRVGLLADMPVGRPGELAEAGDAARLGHAGQTEIEPVGQQPRHEDAVVGGGLAGAQMGEAVGEQRPSRHLGQQVGDADARQHGVEALGQSLGLRRRRFLDRRDLQHAFVDRDARQQCRPWRGRRSRPAARPAAHGDPR